MLWSSTTPFPSHTLTSYKDLKTIGSPTKRGWVGILRPRGEIWGSPPPQAFRTCKQWFSFSDVLFLIFCEYFPQQRQSQKLCYFLAWFGCAWKFWFIFYFRSSRICVCSTFLKGGGHLRPKKSFMPDGRSFRKTLWHFSLREETQIFWPKCLSGEVSACMG